MLEFKEVKKVQQDYGDEAIKVLSSKMDEYGLENLQDTLRQEIVTDGQSSDLNVYMAFYGEFVDSGRKPGKFAPVQVISDWCDRRGFNGGEHNKQGFNTATYPVNFKIARDGIEARPFLNLFLDLYPKYDTRFADALAIDVIEGLDLESLENKK
jgi:hypothetical protein